MKSRKLNAIVFFIAGILLIPQLSWAQQTTESSRLSLDQPLTLEECVQYALDNNYNLRATKLQEGIAETQVGETRAIGLPQASIGSNLNYNYEIQRVFLPNSIITGDTAATGNTPAQFSTQYDANAAFSVSQLLFDGSYFVGLQAAKTLRELRQKESQQAEIVTVENVTKAYYTVLINQERLKLVDANIEQLQKLYKDTKALYDNGFAENIDVDRVQVNLNNTRTEKNKLDRGISYALNLLKFQMGVSINTAISLSGDVEQLSLNVTDYLQPESSFDYKQRIEYKILNVNNQLTQLDLKNNKVSHLPTLSANFRYGYNTGVNDFDQIGNFPNRWFSFGSVGLSFQWRLFTGLSRSYKMEKNRIQLDQLEVQREQLENSIDLELNQLKDNLRSLKEELDIQDDNRKLANKVFDQSQIKYNNGVGSSTELIEAETARKTAETNYFNALYDAVITKIELERALGILY